MALHNTDRAAWRRLRDEVDAGVPLETIAEGFGVSLADLIDWIFTYRESAEDKADYKKRDQDTRDRARRRVSFKAIDEMNAVQLHNARASAGTVISVEREKIRRIDQALERKGEAVPSQEMHL